MSKRFIARGKECFEMLDCGELGFLPVALTINLPGSATKGKTCFRGRFCAGLVFAGQKPAGKRIVRNHANVLLATQGKEFVLDFTEQHIVAWLDTLEARQAELVALPQG